MLQLLSNAVLIVVDNFKPMILRTEKTVQDVVVNTVSLLEKRKHLTFLTVDSM